MEIAVPGLKEWGAQMRSLDLAAEVKEAHRSIGRKVNELAEARKASLEAKYGAYRKVKINPSATQARVQVAVGPKAFGFAGEFGAFTHPVFGHDRNQDSFRHRVWPAWTGNRATLNPGQTSGLLVLPTVAEHRQALFDEYLDAVDRATAKAFPEKG